MKAEKNLLKKLYRYLLKSLKNKRSNRYYKSIEELPVYNWWKLKETKDYKHLLNDPKKRVNKYAPEIFKAIDWEFIDVFGIDKRYELYLDKLVQLTLINIKIANSKDRSDKIFADNLEFEIEELLTEDEKNAFNDKGFSSVSKYLGSSVKIKEITVYEFYSHIEALKREIKQG